MKKGLLVLTLLTLSGCGGLMGERGNGVRVTKTINVDDFTQIDVSGAFEITLVPSGSNEVVIEADENLLAFIEVSVVAGRLFVDSKRRLISRQGINLQLPVRKLTRLESSGAANITSSGQLSSHELALEISGAGKLDLQLDVKFVSLELSGATAVYLEGAAKRLEVDMSGAGSLEADGFEVEECSVDISGVGTALVNVTGSLDASVSGLGKVSYVGNPKTVKGDVSGVGDIDKAHN